MSGGWAATNPFAGPGVASQPAPNPGYGNIPLNQGAPQQMPGRQAYGGSSGSTHSYSLEERRAFSEYLNQLLADDPDLKSVLPLNPNSDDLFRVASQGLLLCKLINKIKPGTINERRIVTKPNPNTFEVMINHDLAIQGAKELGCSVINIGGTDLINGTPHLILGLVWQSVKIGLLSQINVDQHPELVVMMDQNEDVKTFMNVTPEQNLIRWFNYHLRRAGHPRQVNNFSSDIADGENYLVLLSQIAPGVVPRDSCREPNPSRRADMVCSYADRLDCRKFVSPGDILAGNDKLNLAFTAYLFNKYPGLDMPDDNVSSARLQEAESLLQEKFKREDEERRLRWEQEEADRQRRWQQEEAERRRALEDEEAARRRALEQLSEQERLQREALDREAAEKRRQLELMEQQRRQMEEEHRRQDMLREQQRLEEEERRRRFEAEQKRREAMMQEEAARRREEDLRRQEEERRRRWEEEQRRQEEEAMRREEERQRVAWEQDQARLALQSQQAALEEQKRKLAADQLEVQRQQAWAQYNNQQAELQRRQTEQTMQTIQQQQWQEQQRQQQLAEQQRQAQLLEQQRQAQLAEQQRQQQLLIQQQQWQQQQQQLAYQTQVTQTQMYVPPPATTITTTTTYVRGRYPIPRVIVSVIRGRRMSKKDTLSRSDPYVVLMHNGLRLKTSTIKNTQDPVWNQDFELSVLHKHTHAHS
eukprot:TRINITY_DN1355_c0_g1_i2.p1 TRINITY_DN1355_c0_g1~~TRINITY_DN1355_c0_g1_i2.p1  ORF type:complete len:703 (-),score=225.91 TRINITY_DN1355_c0_g1_i2:487-2595(-)